MAALEAAGANREHKDVVGSVVTIEGRRRSDGSRDSGLRLRSARLKATFLRKRAHEWAALPQSHGAHVIACDAPGVFDSICDHCPASLNCLQFLDTRNGEALEVRDLRRRFERACRGAYHPECKPTTTKRDTGPHQYAEPGHRDEEAK